MSETLRRHDAGRPRRKAWLAWSCCASAAVTIGLLYLVDRWGVPGAFICAVLGALSAAVIASAIWSGDDDARGAIRRMIRMMLVAGVAGPAAIGLVAEFDFTGVLMVLILAGTYPALVAFVRKRWFTSSGRPPHQDKKPARARRRRRRADSTAAGNTPAGNTPAGSAPARNAPTGHTPAGNSAAGTTPAGRTGADESETDLGLLGDAALCLAWRRSFIQLEAARSTYERLAIVEQRQRYLDELHRRSPDGLAAWFASGARASGNPLPYVDENRRRID